MNIEYIHQRLLKKNIFLPKSTIKAVIEEYEAMLSEEKHAAQFAGEIIENPGERDDLDEAFPGQYK